MQLQRPIQQDLVLVGGGHAHVHVLKNFGMKPVPGVRVTLVARDAMTPYSGMLPGYVAASYEFKACHIDLRRLCRFAGARLIHAEAGGLDRARQHLLCGARPPIRYDVLSLDIGSAPRQGDVPGAAEHTIPVKPIAGFARRWEALLERAHATRGTLRLAVVGGGAGGVELALAAHFRLSQIVDVALSLVTRGTLLSSHNARVQARFRRLMAARGIALLEHTQITRVEPGAMRAGNGATIPFDEALWVTEAGAASWLAATGLPLDAKGFVSVDETWRSPGDPLIFAAGDVAAMADHPREKAGVYAVRAGPPLARNLRRALSGLPPLPAPPQKRGLALIGTGDGRAIASRGWISAEGAALWRLKDWIDRRWMRGFTELPVMAVSAEEETMRCGGCAAKVPAPVLSRVMARLGADRAAQLPKAGGIEIGLDSPDDAALFALPGGTPMLQTVDFFRAMVDDPYLFGRIAATHALGDIYAMGGTPAAALAIATVPPGKAEIVEHDLHAMLRGGIDVLDAAGAALVGGHSAEAAELGLGFAVTGQPPTGRVLRKGGLRAGDTLILTKPLGTGVILAAEMRGLAVAAAVEASFAAMLQAAGPAAICLMQHGATACTDVTGFGLLGHLLEMLQASAADARLDPARLPAIDGALALLRAGIRSSLHPENWAAATALDSGDLDGDDPVLALLVDPQTAGGLLAGVPASDASACLAALRRLGYDAASIGRVTPRRGTAPRVSLETGCLDRPTVAAGKAIAS